MLGTRLFGDIFTDYVKAGSHNCSPDMLEAMAHSSIDLIRLRVAENPRTPVEALEVLASDKNTDVRIAVGTNPSTPPYLSYQLAFDEDPSVRLGLADDVNAPLELLEKLGEDANPYVSYRAKQTREIVESQGMAKTIGCQFTNWVAKGMDEPELRYA